MATTDPSRHAAVTRFIGCCDTSRRFPPRSLASTLPSCPRICPRIRPQFVIIITKLWPTGWGAEGTVPAAGCFPVLLSAALSQGLLTRSFYQDYELAKGQNDVNIHGKALKNRAINGIVLRLVCLRLYSTPSMLKYKCSNPRLIKHLEYANFNTPIC